MHICLSSKQCLLNSSFVIPTKEHESYFYHSSTCPELAYIVILCNFYANEELHDISLKLVKKFGTDNVTLVTELFTLSTMFYVVL